ncbi:hypothetical protein SAMN04490208_3688 [Pseudomonas poae]|uniref:HEPN domain-containing protein n=1 Tax=Pseudomonas poae TaxID=200451 RepID=A0ABY0RS02_9PSED|nr:hypothetical protein SAMN04490208_3688 [Pseudomonas poae]
MDSKANLENLQRSGLKVEPPDRNECDGLMRSARDRLKDAATAQLSFASRFDLAYNAAHAMALTALRPLSTEHHILIFTQPKSAFADTPLLQP